MSCNIMLFKKLNDDCKIPYKASAGSVAFDLHSSCDGKIEPRGRLVVSTGLAIGFPKGYGGIIKPRSGLSVKHGIDTGAGVIDNDYTGEVKVVLFNHSDKIFRFRKHDRIAQLMLVPIVETNVKVVESLEKTERGSNGFGSTGN